MTNQSTAQMLPANFSPHNTHHGLSCIALVIRAKDGPRFVFHYPPHFPHLPPMQDFRYGTELDDEKIPDDGDDYDDDSDLEDGGIQVQQAQHATGELKLEDNANGNHSKRHYASGEVFFDDNPITFDDGSETLFQWERMGEFETTDLESILTPSRAFNKKKFVLDLGPLICVSYPIHIREDGTWKKKSKKKNKKKKSAGNGESLEQGGKKPDDNAKEKTAESDDEDDRGGMTMFNIVFCLNVSPEEQDEIVDQMYEHVIKKFNKALCHAQASSDYIWKESELMLSMKEKAREQKRPISWLWSNILVKSSLARATRDVFDAISTGQIATIDFDSTPPLDLQLQIPIPSFLYGLPSPVEKSMPGLLVTTADPFLTDEREYDIDSVNKHFALLLLGDEDDIMALVQSDDGKLAAALLECIRLCKPTVSFSQVAQANGVEIDGLLMLAAHLIYWRKAIAIPPLHPRETYIVSPNADNHKLADAGKAWSKKFPYSPRLPNFLAHLAAAPRPYKTFFPSKAHRESYIAMLGWLIRGGWVTQLYTFAWVLVWPEIIYEAEYQMKSDAIAKRANQGTSKTASSISAGESGSENDKDQGSGAPLAAEQVAEHARLDRLAVKEVEDYLSEAAELAKKPKPVATASPSFNLAEHLKEIQPYVIKDPHKLSHVESMYVATLAKRFTEPKVHDAFDKYLKYFNGHESLEMIPAREGLKRKEIWALLMNFSEHLTLNKHW